MSSSRFLDDRRCGPFVSWVTGCLWLANFAPMARNPSADAGVISQPSPQARGHGHLAIKTAEVREKVEFR
jgi:hypothetical protein